MVAFTARGRHRAAASILTVRGGFPHHHGSLRNLNGDFGNGWCGNTRGSLRSS